MSNLMSLFQEFQAAQENALAAARRAEAEAAKKAAEAERAAYIAQGRAKIAYAQWLADEAHRQSAAKAKAEKAMQRLAVLNTLFEAISEWAAASATRKEMSQLWEEACKRQDQAAEMLDAVLAEKPLNDRAKALKGVLVRELKKKIAQETNDRAVLNGLIKKWRLEAKALEEPVLQTLKVAKGLFPELRYWEQVEDIDLKKLSYYKELVISGKYIPGYKNKARRIRTPKKQDAIETVYTDQDFGLVTIGQLKPELAEFKANLN